jgi:uncharacterized protein
MRVKHQPTRTCIACREAKPKKALIRIGRSPEGAVAVDPTGKARGRGAYLCNNSSCWERALKRRILNHALKCELDPETVQRLQQHAASLERDPMET